MNQTRGRNVTQVEERVFTGLCDRLADAIDLSAIDREIGANIEAPRNAFFFLTGNPVNLFGPRLGHFDQVVQVLLR